jgi:hypothetical protein
MEPWIPESHRMNRPGLGSERGNVTVRVGFRRRIWIWIWWRLLPDLRVFPAVVGEDREGVWGLVAGDGVRQRFDDRRRPAVVGVTQSAGPAEDAELRLVQCPAALVFEPVVVAAGVAEVGSDGRPALGVVKGVVLSALRAGARQPTMVQYRSRISR